MPSGRIEEIHGFALQQHMRESGFFCFLFLLFNPTGLTPQLQL